MKGREMLEDKIKLRELFYSANEKFENNNCTDEEAIEILIDFLIENGVSVQKNMKIVKLQREKFRLQKALNQAEDYLEIAKSKIKELERLVKEN